VKRDKTKFTITMVLSGLTLLIVVFGIVDPNRQIIPSFTLRPGE